MGFLGLGKGKVPAASAEVEVAEVASAALEAKKPDVTRSRKIEPSSKMVTRPSRKVVAVTKAVENPAKAKAGVAPAVDAGDELDLLSDIPAAKSVAKSAGPLTKRTTLSGEPISTGPARSGDQALQQFLVTTSKMITADQFATLKAKADADAVPYDMAGVALKLFTEEQLVSGLTTLCYVPNLKLDKYGIRKKALDTVPMEDALRCGVIPVDKLGSLLTLAMVNPLDVETVRAIEAKTGLEVKKVVAPRSEILQAIDRYYNGKVEAKDVTLSFSAEPSQETKSVQQLLGNVKEVGSGSSAAKPAVSAKPVAAAPAASDIGGDIQDIDDLLAADDIVSPEIIEPLKNTEGPTTGFAANPMIVPPEDVLDLPDTALEPRRASPAAVAKPSEAAPIQSPTTRTTMPQSLPGQGTQSVKPAQTGPALMRIPVVDLVPVLEDEFRHAITHGKAHVFEKWVGLQTRPRVINPVPVDADVANLLAPLFTEPRKAG